MASGLPLDDGASVLGAPPVVGPPPPRSAQRRGPGALRIDRRAAGHRVDVVLSGEVDVASCDELHACLARISPGATEVVLDLQGVTFLDSTGLAEIIRTAQHLRPDGGVVRVRNPHPHVRRLLEVTGLTELLTDGAG